MAIRKETVRYELNGTAFEAVAAWDDAADGPRPGVLIAPSFMDRTAFEEERAERLVALGYTAFVMDLYGAAVNPTGPEEAMAAMKPLNDDRRELGARMTAAWEQMRGLDAVDAARTAAIGFCFGGKAVLDLARTGAELAGVAPFHGIFDKPTHPTAERIAAKVLLLHGWDDPLATPDAVLALADELNGKGADWELVAYGHTQHGFTNPKRPEMYRAEADTRSWARLEDFLRELFPA
jgi:dienelactone hydrolase